MKTKVPNIREPESKDCWCHACCYKRVWEIVKVPDSYRASDSWSNSVLEQFKTLALKGDTVKHTVEYWKDIYGFNNFQAVRLFNLYYEWEKHWVSYD